MQYHDLQDLIRHSSSSRRYFLSLPVEMQHALHEQNAYIRSAAELHARADAINRLDRLARLGGFLRDRRKG